MKRELFLDGKTEEEFVAFLQDEYTRRRSERKTYELDWQLDLNFVAGNQYCFVTSRGDIAETPKAYDWQPREVFNHLAPILETRLAKLSRVRPKMAVQPASDDDADVYTARTATAVLDSVADRIGFSDLVAAASAWSETCGTVFYKVEWDGSDVRVSVVPPFEFFPDSGTNEELFDCASVLHARALAAEEVRDAYGVPVEGETLDVFSFAATAGGGTSKLLSVPVDRSVLVLEYYERPTKRFPDGRFAVVAGGALVRIGALPYRNGVDGARGFPFVKQVSVRQPGCFWGTSVVERAIPVQRAYNAVKNRKHEFLNRLTAGVLAVEDGSVDTDDLEIEGLNPGKILVYRQGAVPPQFLDTGHLPHELAQEEDRLLAEFIAISGVSELMRSSTTSHSVNSGVALQLLIEQDDTRLAVTAEQVKAAIRGIAAQILRLYRQYASEKRMARFVGTDGRVECRYWSASDITSDDVTFVTENELSSTPASRRQFVFDLLKTGLLQNEDGKLDDRTRLSLLETLGYGLWESAKDTEALHVKRAIREQLELGERLPVVKSYDDHRIHIDEHTKFLLGGEFAELERKHPGAEAMLCAHIADHRSAQFTEGNEVEKTQRTDAV